MNTENQDFKNLRRMLQLKRYEQPPPRYFNDFSSQVINRIKAGGNADAEQSLSAAAWEVPWLQRLLGVFEQKPMFAGAFGAVICGLLVAAAVYSETGPLTSGDSHAPQLATPANVALQAFAQTPAAALNTNQGSLFDALGSLQPQNASGHPFGQLAPR